MRKANPKSPANSPVTTVDEYLALLPEHVQSALQGIRRAIRTSAPNAEELISYRIPAYRQNGMLIFFAGFKNHCSLFLASKAVVKAFSKELEPYHAAGATIQFSPEKPVPASLVKKMVKAKLEENEARLKKKVAPAKSAPPRKSSTKKAGARQAKS